MEAELRGREKGGRPHRGGFALSSAARGLGSSCGEVGRSWRTPKVRGACTVAESSSHRDHTPRGDHSLPLSPLLHRPTTLARPSSSSLLLGILLLLSWHGCCLPGAVDAAEYGDVGAAAQKDWRITCYTCVNVSNNDECNRYAIDRPCPEGGDYCLTLHVMDALDRERSLLVNKRCASLDDCTGDSTGCTTAYGQTQCVSCCDQPYCNDSVPSNSTNAVFYRSSASGMVIDRRNWGTAWSVAVVLIPALKVLTFGGPS